MDSNTRFVATAWRNSYELLQLRQDLYASDTSKRQRAVRKVFAWRLRKPDGLPLLLESTADIVDVMLQDARGSLPHNALRLLYATALSRFVTGLADTQIDLTRDRPSWFPSGKSLQLPLTLLETRHRIVHRHLPSLAELKRAATQSLEWLWDWYWTQLDYAFTTATCARADEDEELGVESRDAIKDRLQGILKTYVKDRKAEIKRRKEQSTAAETALSTYMLRFSSNTTTTPLSQVRRVLVEQLVDAEMILPSDKKLGSSMSGAFLIWTPLLLAFSTGAWSEPRVLSVHVLVERLIQKMNSDGQTTVDPERDPVKEGLLAWALHVITSDSWAPARRHSSDHGTHEQLLARLFSAPSFWSLRMAETLLEAGHVTNVESWRAVLAAAREDDSVSQTMHVDVDSIAEAMPVGQADGEWKDKEKEKVQGPVKLLGMWKPRRIGWMPEGWSDDEQE
ncbi:rRNA-processing protein las1 [Exserohilum turcicum]